ncbi:PAS domain-containing protein [Frankia sp. AgB1.8]|nr:PAS domain-containing protein [Frankia sp. AgB1.8]
MGGDDTVRSENGFPPADLFDQMQIGLAIIGDDGHRVIRVNPAICRVLGRSEAELVGAVWDSLVHPDDRDPQGKGGGLHAASIPSGGQKVVRFVRPDKSLAQVLATSAPISCDRGRKPCRIVQFQDVTQEMASYHHLKLLLDNTRVVLTLIDRHGRSVLSEGAQARGEYAHRRSIARWTSILEAYAEFPEPMGLAREALAGRPASGVYEAAGLWLDSHAVPIFGADDTVDSVAIITTDVTERELALSLLRAQSAGQAIVAELGRYALDDPEPARVWRRAARAIREHLQADRVTLQQTRPRDGGRPLVVSADAGSARSRCPPTRPVVARAPALGGAAAPDQPRSSSPLSRPVGRPDDPCATLTVQRAAPDAFTAREVEFLEAVATVLAAADARFRAEGQVRHQAVHDGLTGLPNRTALLDKLNRAGPRSAGTKRRTVVPRPRRLQNHQRFARPPGRGPASPRGRRPAASGGAPLGHRRAPFRRRVRRTLRQRPYAGGGPGGRGPDRRPPRGPGGPRRPAGDRHRQPRDRAVGPGTVGRQRPGRRP